MRVEKLEDLYAQHVQEIYDVETKLGSMLEKFSGKAQTDELKDELERERNEINEQCGRLENIAERHGIDLKGYGSKAMDGWLEEADDLSNADGDDKVREAGFVSLIQRVKHHEMAEYGTMRTFAKHLGYDDDMEVLSSSLDEEKEDDSRLTDIAENNINPVAEA